MAVSSRSLPSNGGDRQNYDTTYVLAGTKLWEHRGGASNQDSCGRKVKLGFKGQVGAGQLKKGRVGIWENSRLTLNAESRRCSLGCGEQWSQCQASTSQSRWAQRTILRSLDLSMKRNPCACEWMENSGCKEKDGIWCIRVDSSLWTLGPGTWKSICSG